MTHFFGQFGISDKMACFQLCVPPVLMQNLQIWNSHGSLAMNNLKLICYFTNPWYATVSNMTHFVSQFGIREIMARFYPHFQSPVFWLQVNLSTTKAKKL